MNILFMADVPPNPDSGAAGTEVQTIEAMRALGHEVDALWSHDLPHKIRHGNLHYLFELPLAYRKLMLERLSAKKYDVIHVNQPHGYLTAKTLRRLRSRTIFIHRSHGFELRVQRDLMPWQKLYGNDKRPTLRRILSKLISSGLSYHSRNIARYADGHIVSASQCAEFLHTVMGVPDDQIAVIPQAAPAMFSESPPKQMTFARLNRILYVGQFAFMKAPMILAEVFNQVAAERGDIEFTWVCSKRHHKEAAALLKDQAINKVALLDWMDQESLMHIYDQHGIFLFPSFFEGFGKVFLEAMARGLCVVAADNGGAHDVIKSGETGILLPTGDVRSMVNACLYLAGNPADAEEISQKAATSAREYTWDRVARETLSFYEKRIEAKGRELSGRLT